MTNDADSKSLSPTVLQVIDKFAAAMRADDEIDGDAIDRLEKLLRRGDIPKPDEMFTALFIPPQEGET